jgi:hypothetical protein
MVAHCPACMLIIERRVVGGLGGPYGVYITKKFLKAQRYPQDSNWA